jgi:hypothetical protein
MGKKKATKTNAKAAKKAKAAQKVEKKEGKKASRSKDASDHDDEDLEGILEKVSEFCSPSCSIGQTCAQCDLVDAVGMGPGAYCLRGTSRRAA